MTSIHDALGRLWDANDGDRMLERDGSWASWGSVRSLTERIDRELTAAGCQAGGRVAVVLSNRMESVAALIAIFRGGRTLVTISPLQPPDRLSDDLAASGVSLRPCARRVVVRGGIQPRRRRSRGDRLEARRRRTRPAGTGYEGSGRWRSSGSHRDADVGHDGCPEAHPADPRAARGLPGCGVAAQRSRQT